MTDAQREQRRALRRRQARIQRLLLAGALLILVLCIVLIVSRCGKKETGAADPAAVTDPEVPPADTLPETDALPGGWERRDAADAELSRGTLMLVNRDYGYDAGAQETVSVYERKTDNYLIRSSEISLREDAMDALNRWIDAFADRTGVTNVNVVAGWRSYDEQATLYRNAVEQEGQAYADAYLALPGHSEHHTGLAVDLDTYDMASGASGGFDGGGDYAWAVEHAWEYGFIQRYPPQKSAITGINYESWHFRYVGLPHAYVMQTENLCLEEYIEYLRGFPFSGEHLRVTCLGRDYELYFCPKDELIVPAGRSFTVSGNNVDGYIVTAEQSGTGR